jgi:hypothetical protein
MAWPEDSEENPFTSSAPDYLPAAVSPGRVTLGYGPPWRTSAEGKPSTKALWFAGNGATLLIHLADGSVAVVDADGNHAIRRFPAATSARSIDVSSDGNTALILYADGRVDAWDLRTFGEDGRIAAKASPLSGRSRP